MNDVPRVTLSAVHSATGVPMRTLQHWMKAHARTRTPYGYPLALIEQVLSAKGHSIALDANEMQAPALRDTPTEFMDIATVAPVLAEIGALRAAHAIAEKARQDGAQATQERLDTLLGHLQTLTALQGIVERLQAENAVLRAENEHLKSRRWWQR